MPVFCSRPEEHVVDDVEVVAQREVLVDDLDAERVGVASARGPCTGWPSKRYLAVVERVDARDALDQRALAGAVVTDQRGDLAGETSRSTSRGRAPRRSSC